MEEEAKCLDCRGELGHLSREWQTQEAPAPPCSTPAVTSEHPPSLPALCTPAWTCPGPATWARTQGQLTLGSVGWKQGSVMAEVGVGMPASLWAAERLLASPSACVSELPSLGSALGLSDGAPAKPWGPRCSPTVPSAEDDPTPRPPLPARRRPAPELPVRGGAPAAGWLLGWQGPG